MHTVSSSLIRVLYRQPDSGYSVLKLQNGQVVCGKMATEPLLQCDYTFMGEYTQHARHGRQLRFASYREDIPTSIASIHYYLQRRCPDVGQVRAHALTEAFGEDTIQTLKNEPEKATSIPGLTLDRAYAIQTALKEAEGDEQLVLDIVQALSGEPLSPGIIDAIKSQWSAEAPSIISRLPYELVRVRGIGFSMADRVARRNGFAATDPRRVEAGVMHVLKNTLPQEGHICLPESELIDSAVELLGVERERIATSVDTLLSAGVVVRDDYRLYHQPRHVEEVQIARHIARLMSSECRAQMVAGVGEEGLADDQCAALSAARESPVFVLTGAPGVGNTHMVKALIAAFGEGHRIALCAPTGKAARVLSEATGRSASTIHRLLEPIFDGKEFLFRRGAEGRRLSVSDNKGKPIKQTQLEYDVIISDESSMIDQGLFRSLLDAVTSGTKLIVVGDHYQLPSVGAGNVLRDLLAAGVPHVELTEIKRQASGSLIVAACHKIKDGQNFDWLNENGSDLMFVPCSSEHQIARFVVDAVDHRLRDRYGWDWRKDIQCLTAIHASPLGTKHLNEQLQARLVPTSFRGSRWRIGDRVIQTRNDYELRILNGDVGTIEKIVLDCRSPHIVVKFDAYDACVEVPAHINKLSLAYCLSVHKFQGSETPGVIIPLHRCLGGMIPARSWLYTALSRGKKLAIMVGDQSQLDKIIRRVAQHERHTGLAERIQKALR